MREKRPAFLFLCITTTRFSFQVEAVIHFEDDTEELQQWDQQVFSANFIGTISRKKFTELCVLSLSLHLVAPNFGIWFARSLACVRLSMIS